MLNRMVKSKLTYYTYLPTANVIRRCPFCPRRHCVLSVSRDVQFTGNNIVDTERDINADITSLRIISDSQNNEFTFFFF